MKNIKLMLILFIFILLACEKNNESNIIEKTTEKTTEKKSSFYVPVPSASMGAKGTVFDSILFYQLPEKYNENLVVYLPFNGDALDKSVNQLTTLVVSSTSESMELNKPTDTTSTFIKFNDNPKINFKHSDVFSLCVWYNYSNKKKANLGQGLISKLNATGNEGYSIQFCYPDTINNGPKPGMPGYNPNKYYDPKKFPLKLDGKKRWN